MARSYVVNVVLLPRHPRNIKQRIAKYGKLSHSRQWGADSHAAQIACEPGVDRVEVERVDRVLINTHRRGCDGKCKQYRKPH